MTRRPALAYDLNALADRLGRQPGYLPDFGLSPLVVAVVAALVVRLLLVVLTSRAMALSAVVSFGLCVSRRL